MIKRYQAVVVVVMVSVVVMAGSTRMLSVGN